MKKRVVVVVVMTGINGRGMMRLTEPGATDQKQRREGGV